MPVNSSAGPRGPWSDESIAVCIHCIACHKRRSFDRVRTRSCDARRDTLPGRRRNRTRAVPRGTAGAGLGVKTRQYGERRTFAQRESARRLREASQSRRKKTEPEPRDSPPSPTERSKRFRVQDGRPPARSLNVRLRGARLAPYGACDTILSICINSDAVSLKMGPLGLEAALLLDTQRSLLCVLHIFAFSSSYYCRWLLSVGQSRRPLISSLSTTGGKRLRRSIRGSACCGTALPPQRRVPWWPSSHST